LRWQRLEVVNDSNFLSLLWGSPEERIAGQTYRTGQGWLLVEWWLTGENMNAATLSTRRSMRTNWGRVIGEKPESAA